MNGPSDERVTEWAGGPLSELMGVLSAAALPARIRVFAPGAGDAPAGEVHLLAGGLNDAFAGDQRGQEAVSALQRVTGARFEIDTRLPDPETGSLAKPGPGEGNLAQRPLVEIMRYCEEYVLTCTLEVWRGEEEARISYRRGELVGTMVGGSDAPERLPEVMNWKEGFFEIVLPLPVTPPVLASSKRNTGTAAVVGDSVAAAPERPPSEERPRRQTDPFITVDAMKRTPPSRPAGALRPTGESGPRLPPGPPLPGLKGRLSPTVRTQPAAGAGTRPAPAGPALVPPLLAPPTAKTAPSPAPTSAAAAPAGTAPAPVAARTALGMPSARPLSTPAGAAQAAGTTPTRAPAAPAPEARKVAPSPPASATGLPVARAPGTAPAARASLPAPPLATPTARDARPAAVSSQVPVPSPAAKPSVAQLAAKPTAALAPKAVAAPPPQDSATSSPPSSSPAPLPAAAPAAPVQPTTPSLAEPPSDEAVSAAAGQQPGTASRPSKPSESPASSAIRGASTAAANLAPSALNHISGEIQRPSTPVRGTDERPFGVELAEDMQDPAAFVATPPPVQSVVMSSRAQTTPTPISPAPQPAGRPDDEFAALDAGPSEDLSVDIEAPRSRPGKRRAQQEPTGWPWLVHVLIGVVLGAAVVVAYSAYYGLPLP